jgi:hypothetical protein
MPLDSQFSMRAAEIAKRQSQPQPEQAQSPMMSAVGSPMPEMNIQKEFMKVADYPRNMLFKALSGIDKERVGGTDVLEKIGMDPGMKREMLGLVMDTGADPLNALTAVPGMAKKLLAARKAALASRPVERMAANPALAEVLDIFSRNKAAAADVPAFQKQGKVPSDIEALIDAKRSMADRTPVASPDVSAQLLNARGSDVRLTPEPMDKRPEAVRNLVQRMRAGGGPQPDINVLTNTRYAEGMPPGGTAKDMLRTGRRGDAELLRARGQADKEAMLRELTAQPLAATEANPSRVIEGLKRLGYSDNEIVRMTGAEREALWRDAMMPEKPLGPTPDIPPAEIVPPQARVAQPIGKEGYVQSAEDILAGAESEQGLVDKLMQEEAQAFGMSVEEYTKKILGKDVPAAQSGEARLLEELKADVSTPGTPPANVSTKAGKIATSKRNVSTRPNDTSVPKTGASVPKKGAKAEDILTGKGTVKKNLTVGKSKPKLTADDLLDELEQERNPLITKKPKKNRGFSIQ